MRKQPPLRLLAVALFTFFAGVMIVAVLLGYRRHDAKESIASPCFPPANSKPRISGSVDQFYFPPLAFSPDNELNHTRAMLPANILATMEEPSYLAITNCGGKSYRFLLIHTNHPPIVVRVWKSGNEAHLVTKQLDGEGGDKFGVKLVMRTHQITEQEWMTIESLLNRASFWTLPTFSTALSTQQSSDSTGSLWIIEGFDNQHYHIVNRWSPQNSDYRSIGLYLLELGKVEIDKKYLMGSVASTY